MRGILIVAVVLWALASAGASSEKITYDAIWLPLLEGHARGSARAINDACQIVGDSESYPVLWEAGKPPKCIGEKSKRSASYASDITETGTVVVSSDGIHIWTPKSDTIIGFGASVHVNESLQISGTSWFDDSQLPQACVWTSKGECIKVGSFSGDGASCGNSINDSGTVVGYSGRASWRAFVWTQKNGMSELLPPVSAQGKERVAAIAWDINNQGAIAGQWGWVFTHRACSWKADGTAVDISGGSDSNAQDINENGQIAGSSVDPATHNYGAVIWDASGKMTRLPMPEGYVIPAAYCINNKGWVVGAAGVGSEWKGGSRPVLWIPRVVTEDKSAEPETGSAGGSAQDPSPYSQPTK